MSTDDPEQISINDLISEEGAHQLASSPDMKPYLDLIMAEMQGTADIFAAASKDMEPTPTSLRSPARAWEQSSASLPQPLTAVTP